MGLSCRLIFDSACYLCDLLRVIPLQTFQVLDGGVATFSALEFDGPGNGYFLVYSLYSYSSPRGEWTATGVNITSDPLTVYPGTPARLAVAQVRYA